MEQDLKEALETVVVNRTVFTNGQTKELWKLYFRVFKRNPAGSMGCGSCVRDTHKQLLSYYKQNYPATPNE